MLEVIISILYESRRPFPSLSVIEGLFFYSGKKRHKKTVLSDGFLMAGATGLEPATYGVTGRHSNQTELRPRDRFVYIGFFFPLQELFSIF